MDDTAPTAEDVNLDMMQSVRNVASLADLSISMWSGVKTDKKRLEELKKIHGAQGDVGRVVINILAGADAPLKLTHAAFNAIRTYHYQATQPWTSNPNRRDGARLLSNKMFAEYVTKIFELETNAKHTLEDFLRVYEAEVIPRAKANLGTMAGDVYPTVDEVRSKFSATVEYSPVPDISHFPGIPADFENAFRTLMARRHKKMIEGAQQAMWEEAHEKIKHLVERLQALAEDDVKEGKRSTRFHTTVVEHVRSLLKYLPGWNLCSDPRVDELVEDIKLMLDNVDADMLKDNIQARDETLGKAQSLMDKLNNWGTV